MIHFKEYIRENKYELFRYVKDNVELINFMLKSMGENFITHKDTFDLLDQADENNAEVNAALIEYINKNYNTESKDIESTIDNKFDLGKFDEEKNKEKKIKKGE